MNHFQRGLKPARKTLTCEHRSETFGLKHFKTDTCRSNFYSKSAREEPEKFQLSGPAVRRHTPHAPTQLRLARSLARTTRTRNESEIDFPVQGATKVLTPPKPPTYNMADSRLSWQWAGVSSRARTNFGRTFVCGRASGG